MRERRGVENPPPALRLVNHAEMLPDMRSARAGDQPDIAGRAFHGLPNTPWQGPSYRVPLRDYTSLDPPLEREDFLESPVGAAEGAFQVDHPVFSVEWPQPSSEDFGLGA